MNTNHGAAVVKLKTHQRVKLLHQFEHVSLLFNHFIIIIIDITTCLFE